MKKIVIFMVCLLMVVSSSAHVFANDYDQLSSMSEEECIEFLIENEVKFPDDYDDIFIWGPFVKRIISAVEANPNVEFHINYTVTAEFAEAIRSAVLDYYSNKKPNSYARTTELGNTKQFLEHSSTYCTWNYTYSYYIVMFSP